MKDTNELYGNHFSRESTSSAENQNRENQIPKNDLISEFESDGFNISCLNSQSRTESDSTSQEEVKQTRQKGRTGYRSKDDGKREMIQRNFCKLLYILLLGLLNGVEISPIDKSVSRSGNKKLIQDLQDFTIKDIFQIFYDKTSKSWSKRDNNLLNSSTFPQKAKDFLNTTYSSAYFKYFLPAINTIFARKKPTKYYTPKKLKDYAKKKFLKKN